MPRSGLSTDVSYKLCTVFMDRYCSEVNNLHLPPD